MLGRRSLSCAATSRPPARSSSVWTARPAPVLRSASRSRQPGCAVPACSPSAPTCPPAVTALPYALLETTERQLLEASVAGWTEKYPTVALQTRLVNGRTAQALLEASGSAQLIVVGSRGHGGFAGLLLGSVGQQLMHHAACPVQIVHTPGGA
ncbi:universal stress protein [Dactylosporangium sp. NPDC050688]|uniref:universal stress protein n=1 Tax=Dactylosporangium sp. NPDC050688 TaxID=3157217 RepID=UPI0033F5E81C